MAHERIDGGVARLGDFSKSSTRYQSRPNKPNSHLNASSGWATQGNDHISEPIQSTSTGLTYSDRDINTLDTDQRQSHLDERAAYRYFATGSSSGDFYEVERKRRDKGKKLSAAAPAFDPHASKTILGSTTCQSCINDPAYYIVPCDHYICTTCVKPWNANLKAQFRCGFCQSVVERVKGFPGEPPAQQSPNLSGSPHNDDTMLGQGGAFGRVVGATNMRGYQGVPDIRISPHMPSGGPQYPIHISHTMPSGPAGHVEPSPMPHHSQIRSTPERSGFTPSPYQSFSSIQPVGDMLYSNRQVSINAALQPNWQHGTLVATDPYNNSSASQTSNGSFASQIPLPYHLPIGYASAQKSANSHPGYRSAIPNPLAGPQVHGYPPMSSPIPNPLAGPQVTGYSPMPSPIPNPLAGPQVPGYPLMYPMPQPSMSNYGGPPIYAQQQSHMGPHQRDLRYGDGYTERSSNIPDIQYPNPFQHDSYGPHGLQSRPGSVNSMTHSGYNANNFAGNSRQPVYGQMMNQTYHKEARGSTIGRQIGDNPRQRFKENMNTNSQYKDSQYKDSRYKDSQYKGSQYEDSQYEDSQYEDSQYQNAELLGNKNQQENGSSQNHSVNQGFEMRQPTIYESDDNANQPDSHEDNEYVAAPRRKDRTGQYYNRNAGAFSATKVAGEFGRACTPTDSPSRAGQVIPQTAPHHYGGQRIQPITLALRRRGDSSLGTLDSIIKAKPPPKFNLPALNDPHLHGTEPSQAVVAQLLARTQKVDDPFTSTPRSKNPDPFKISPPSGGLANQLVVAGNDLPGVSRQLRLLTLNGQPDVETAFHEANLPFVETARQVGPAEYGVVRITNIPYSVTRAEVLAFLGRNAKLVNELETEPVHIVMERVTSKTMDAYIEFVNEEEAMNAVNRYEINRSGGRGGRLGERHVELEVVGQAQLMKELFPKARNVHWRGARPEIYPVEENDKKYNSGFRGFMIREELVMLVKHVDTPQRSPFSSDCPQRPFECLISTLYKFPWYMVDHITLRERTQIYDATLKLVNLLNEFVNGRKQQINLNMQLLKRVLRAALKCAGFTQSMKAEIRRQAGFNDDEFLLAPYAEHWLFQTINPKKGSEFDTIMYYQALIREAQETGTTLSLAEQAAQGGRHECLNVFGPVIFPYPENVQEMTMAAIAKIEWGVIEKLLRKKLE